MSDSGTITIHFKILSFVRAEVWVDGKKIGNIAGGEVKKFEIDAAQHTIQVKLGHWFSQVLDVDISANNSTMLECGYTENFRKKRLLSFLTCGVLLIMVYGMYISQNLLMLRWFNIFIWFFAVFSIVISLKPAQNLELRGPVG